MNNIEEEVFEQIIKLVILTIKQSALEKKIKNCISCTIKNLFSCCNITPKKELEIVNNEIKELTLKRKSMSIKKIQITKL
jgi:hypothetical protein